MLPRISGLKSPFEGPTITTEDKGGAMKKYFKISVWILKTYFLSKRRKWVLMKEKELLLLGTRKALRQRCGSATFVGTKSVWDQPKVEQRQGSISLCMSLDEKRHDMVLEIPGPQGSLTKWLEIRFPDMHQQGQQTCPINTGSIKDTPMSRQRRNLHNDRFGHRWDAPKFCTSQKPPSLVCLVRAVWTSPSMKGQKRSSKQVSLWQRAAMSLKPSPYQAVQGSDNGSKIHN